MLLTIVLLGAYFIFFWVVIDIFTKKTSGLGYNYRKKLKLDKLQERSLNLVSIPFTDNFCDVDFCIHETIQLYLKIFNNLTWRKKWSNDKVTANLIFEFCKYAVKKQYLYPANEDINHLKEQINPDIQVLILKLAEDLPELDQEQEKVLYANLHYRWEAVYASLEEKYQDGQQFYDDVLHLSTYNLKATTLRSIYFTAHQFTLFRNKEVSVLFYIQYLCTRLGTTSFKHRIINRKNRKLLFTAEQEKVFDQIYNRVLKAKRMTPTVRQNALEAVKELYTVKRKKIMLDRDAILEAGTDHAEVVDLLNDYLSDDDIQPGTVNVPVQQTLVPDAGKNGKSYQDELLQLFISSEYRIGQKDIDTFARSKGLFKSQLIEGINEKYYDELEDILIEEEGEYLILNKEYYQQVAEK